MTYLHDALRRWRWERRLARWLCEFNCWEWPKTFVAPQPKWWGVSVDYDRTHEYCRRAIKALEKVVSVELHNQVWQEFRQERMRRRGDR